jgi:signal transduction histidine kinase
VTVQAAEGQARTGDTGDSVIEWGPSQAFLKTSIGLILVVVVVYIAALALFTQGQGQRMVTAIPFGLVSLVSWVFIMRGKPRVGVWVISVGIWVMSTVACIVLGGMSSSTPVVYPVLVLLAGWMFSARAAFGVALLTAAATLGMVVAEWQGWMPPGPPTLPLMRWYVLCIALALSASLIAFFARGHREQINEVRELGNALTQRNVMLEASQAELHGVLGATADGILAVDKQGKVLFTNRRFAELWRIPQGLLDRKDDQAMLGHVEAQVKDPEAFVNRVMSLYESEAVDTDWIEFKDGRTFERYTEPLMQNGVLIGRVWSFSDITERRRAEAEVAALNASLEERVRSRTAELEAANRELESFSYTISHDLRAPLRSMAGFGGLLKENLGSGLDEESRDYLERIVASSQRMSRLIDGVLEYSRLGKSELVRRPVDLDAMLHEIAGELRERYPATQVSLQPLGEAVADATMLRQIFLNLMDNACKYSSRTPAPRVGVGMERGEHGVEYFVRDNGSGFDMQHADHLFSLFTRLHNDPGIESTGAGLAIVKRLVERHGGSISATAAPGQGATFRFRI